MALKTDISSNDYEDVVSHAGQHNSVNSAVNILNDSVYNVKTYGAVGDGTTNDTSAIQAAIDAANTNGGGIVFLPKGEYKITDALVSYSYISIVGVSAEGTEIVQATSNKDGILIVNTNVSARSIVIENLSIKGTGDGTGNGIYLKNTGEGTLHPPFLYCSFKGLFISEFGGYGFKAEGLIVSLIERVVSQVNETGGFFLDGNVGGDGTGYTSVCTSVVLNDCYANGNFSGIGYKIGSSTYITLNACAADDNATGYYITYCAAIALVGCGSEYGLETLSSPGNSYKVNYSNQVGFYNCYCYQSPATGWWATGISTGITLIGCSENSPNSADYSLRVDNLCSVSLTDCAFNSDTVANGNGAITTLNDVTENTILRRLRVLALANGVEITSAAAGSAPAVSAIGDDDDIDLYLVPKGTRSVILSGPGGRDILKATPVANGVNFLVARNATTGSPALLGAFGSDTNVAFNLTSQGTLPIRLNGTPVGTHKTLTDASTVSIDASLGDTFHLAATDNRTLGIPSNPTSGQIITILHQASGGARTLSLTTTGANCFQFGSDITALTETASGKTDILQFIYNAEDTRWDIINYKKGY